ncbi:hypothetical protein [Rickettsia endosymbiont of Cantharis rufa]|uniref:hypothetical protein n=1 Tax=Rickettsia endosymbiont of Cantharis rufa TaxID=3066248 RepID=UPI003132F2B5
MVTFKDGDCLVILESSELNPEMELVYITTGFYKEFNRTSILQMWILKGYTFNKSSDDFIMNIQ